MSNIILVWPISFIIYLTQTQNFTKKIHIHGNKKAPSLVRERAFYYYENFNSTKNKILANRRWPIFFTTCWTNKVIVNHTSECFL